MGTNLIQSIVIEQCRIFSVNHRAEGQPIGKSLGKTLEPGNGIAFTYVFGNECVRVMPG